MSTRSRIGIEKEDGTIESIYCHFDGYLSHNGKILLEYYTDINKVKELISLGDLSCLGKYIGKKHNFDYSSDLCKDWCLYYYRDREENWEDTKPIISNNREEFCKAGDNYCSYIYLFSNNNRWLVKPDKEFVELKKDMCIS